MGSPVVRPACILSHSGTLRHPWVLCGMGWGDEVPPNGTESRSSHCVASNAVKILHKGQRLHF
jgi:hypothetical protein